MATKEQKQQFVFESAKDFDKIERDLESIARSIDHFTRFTKSAHKLGMSGYLESEKWESRLRGLSGQLWEIRAVIFEAHERATELAKAHDADLPQVRSGGDR